MTTKQELIEVIYKAAGRKYNIPEFTFIPDGQLNAIASAILDKLCVHEHEYCEHTHLPNLSNQEPYSMSIGVEYENISCSCRDVHYYNTCIHCGQTRSKPEVTP